jgi:hypothetical protein
MTASEKPSPPLGESIPTVLEDIQTISAPATIMMMRKNVEDDSLRRASLRSQGSSRYDCKNGSRPFPLD